MGYAPFIFSTINNYCKNSIKLSKALNILFDALKLK